MDGSIRRIVMRAISLLAPQSQDENPDLRSASIKRILLVRANFRMGNAILALPAIAALRGNFPDATIDFVGSPMSNLLFQQQPLNRHYVAPRRFPQVLWQYPRLIRQLRANRYDLALDVSCSQSGAAAFLIALSGARIRAGLAGKWERLFNLKIAKPRERNKYRKLTEFLGALNLEKVDPVGSIKFSPAEKAEGLAKLASLAGKDREKIVGVFVGGRKLRGKRWPLENFADVINGLHHRGVRVVTFLGPEEKDIADSLRASIDSSVPVISEPSVRQFGAMISHLDLLICCDSGPMHLACAAGVRVVAIFQRRDATRWSPPESAARVVCDLDDATAAMVLQATLDELALDRSHADSPPPPAAAIAQN
jgi:heptosyltransferase-3